MKIPLMLLSGIAATLLITSFVLPENSVSGASASAFSQENQKCNTIPKNLRFSCFRANIEKHFTGNVEDYIQTIKNDKTIRFETRSKNNSDISYAIFGTNCHTFYHALGDFVATHKTTDDLTTLINLGPTTCTNGYTMGLYKRTALEKKFPQDLLVEFYQKCREGAQNQCAHEIGHILQDKYAYSILKILDDTSSKNFGLKYKNTYQYASFDKSSLDAPFEDCRKIIKDSKVAQCYTGIGHNLFLFSEFSPDSYKNVFNECSKTKPTNTQNCYAYLIFRIGINDAAAKFLSGKFDEGTKSCNEASALSQRNNIAYHCFLGIGGGIGLWIDSEFAGKEITDENLDEVKAELMSYARLCEKTPQEFVNYCYKGLLGTSFGKMYRKYGMFDNKIEQILPEIEDDFQIVG